MGEPGTKGGPTGNLLVSVRVKPHKILVRDEFDIHIDKTISLAQAVLGDVIKVDTIDGKVEITIPEGTQSGVSLRMKGKGIQRLQASGRGDQYVHITVAIPSKLSDKQKDLLRQFDESMGGTFESNKAADSKKSDTQEKKSFFGKKK